MGKGSGSVQIKETIVYRDREVPAKKPKTEQKAPTAEQKEEAKQRDPYLRKLMDYAQGDEELVKAIKKVSFIPINHKGKLDKFLLAVKYPQLKIDPKDTEEAVEQLAKYLDCNTLPGFYKKSFERAYDALRKLRTPKGIKQFDD